MACLVTLCPLTELLRFVCACPPGAGLVPHRRLYHVLQQKVEVPRESLPIVCAWSVGIFGVYSPAVSSWNNVSQVSC